MKYTHQKRAYRAQAIRWDGTNWAEVAAVLPEAQRLGENYLIRHRGGVSIYPGSWVVTDENGEVKFYPDDVFHITYEVLT